MNLSELVYLDSTFAVETYEEHTGKGTPTKISKTEGASGGLSAGFANAGVATQETKEFPFGVREMYGEFHSTLESKYPKWNPDENSSNSAPNLFWAEGRLEVAHVDRRRDKEVYSRYSYLYFMPESKNFRNGFIVIANDSYFSTGYDQLQKRLGFECDNFCLPIRGLFKRLYEGKEGDRLVLTCCPLVIRRAEQAVPPKSDRAGG